MTFIKHTVNPNNAVGGGCAGTNGVKGFDCKPPFYEMTGLICLNATSPKAVICTHCIGELLRAAGTEAIPAGYATAEAAVLATEPVAVVVHPNAEKPKPAKRQKAKPPAELSL